MTTTRPGPKTGTKRVPKQANLTSRNRTQFLEIPANRQVPNTSEATHNRRARNPKVVEQGRPTTLTEQERQRRACDLVRGCLCHWCGRSGLRFGRHGGADDSGIESRLRARPRPVTPGEVRDRCCRHRPDSPTLAIGLTTATSPSAPAQRRRRDRRAHRSTARASGGSGRPAGTRDARGSYRFSRPRSARGALTGGRWSTLAQRSRGPLQNLVGRHRNAQPRFCLKCPGACAHHLPGLLIVRYKRSVVTPRWAA